jgi:putative ATP-dependent endonuclease of OLD family
MIKEIKVRNLRAFEDSGIVRLSSISPIVGKNDVGKSAILYGLKWFFEPPKRGGIPLDEIHGHNENAQVTIEVAFEPSKLSTTELKLDAKNPTTLMRENLLDEDGLLRLRLTLSSKTCGPLEACIHDIDDTELFGLALLKEGDLLRLLADRGLPAVAAGSETNAEKRDALRKHAMSTGVKMKRDWVNISDYEKEFRSAFPQWSFFTDEARYGIGETNVQNQFKGVVDKVIRELPLAGQIDHKVKDATQEEFKKIFNYLSRMTDAVAGIDSETTVDWKKAVSNIELRWIDSFGVKVPYEMRGSGVRRLFMVAYFQYLTLGDQLHGDTPRYVFGIEEPEVHLHPGAQRLLIEAFNELAGAGHQIIFTTHSPVFAAMSDIDSLTLVERGTTSAEVFQTPDLDIGRVASELGVEVSDRLVGRNYVVLVEGPGDAEFYEEALHQLHAAGHTALDPQDVIFLQCGGVGNLKYVVMSSSMDKVGLHWAVILDSDKEKQGDPPCKAAQKVASSHPQTCQLAHVLERTCLENYLDGNVIKSVTGLDIDVLTYGRLIDRTSGLPLNKNQKRKIRESIKTIAANMGANGLVACSLPPGKTSPQDCELVVVFNGIQKAFGL